MADKIFLQDDEISTKNIKKAVSLLETVTRSSDSLFAATSLYDIASTMQHNVRNSYGVRFLSNAAEEAESIACELEAVAANLASLQKRLTDCPEALQEADKTFKGWNDKSGEHWLSRTFSTLFGTTIGWYLCDLFGIPRNAPVETTVPNSGEMPEQASPKIKNSSEPQEQEDTNTFESKMLERLQIIEAEHTGHTGEEYCDWFRDHYGSGYTTEQLTSGEFGWCDRFVSWVLGQAGIELSEGGCDGQANAFKRFTSFHSYGDGYVVQNGDVVFLDYNKDGSFDHVGIYYEKDGQPYLLHGNWGNKVCVSSLDSSTGCGGSIREAIAGYGDTKSFSIAKHSE